MNRRLVRMAAILLLGFGLWQLGGGLWILAKARLGQHLIRDAWTEARDTGAAPPPWPWADTRPVARLEVPRLEVDLIVLSGTGGRSIAWGPGHQDGSAAPNRRGVAVIAGHRDTHMAFLRDLVPGDEVRLTDLSGRTTRYAAGPGRVLHRDHAYVRPDSDRPRAVLLTCWPFGALVPGGPLRYAVEVAAL